jgi:Kef-type K+ transport system membrane component KefB
MNLPYPISIAEEPILTLGILLLMMIFVPLLFRQFKITGIVGLILAGAITGPNGLGWIEARGVIDVLGIIGLLYLMFMAGLEMNLSRFKKEKNDSLVFGSLTFLLPMISGTIIFLGLGFGMAASLLIASMFASHTLVTYPIITRLNLTREKSVSSAIGATVITDTAALLVIAVVARSVDGELGILFWGTLLLLFACYLVFMFYLLPRINDQFFRYVDDSGRYTFAYVLGMMLLCSWLAYVIGIEAILGAFLAGLAFNRLLSNKGALKNRIDFFGESFFIPIFLIFVGMQVDFRILFSDSFAWMVMLTMLLTGIVTKWLAAFMAGKILKFNSDQIWMMFGMSVTDGAATLAAVFIGYDLGLFGESVYNGAILLILITCLIGPIIVEKVGLKLTDKTTFELEKGFDKEQRVLVPLSNPATSSRLIEFSANICSDQDSTIYPLTILNSVKGAKDQRERADKILELATGQVHAVNHKVYPLFEVNFQVAEGVKLAAEKHTISDIVIGWSGELSTKIKVFGSTVDQVIESSSQQIFVCKIDRPIFTFQKVKLVVGHKMIHENKCIELINTLLQLAENINTPLEVHYLVSDKMPLRRYLNLLKGHIDMNFKEFNSFDLLLDKLFKELNSDDLLLVTNKQSGNYGWANGINTIPRRINQMFPENCFVISYLSRITEEPYSHSSLIYSN